MLFANFARQAARLFLGSALLACSCLIQVGCGGADGPIKIPLEGAVAIGSQPLKEGVVRFIPIGDTHGPAATATVKDGVYTFADGEGVLPGKHRVEIEAINHLGFALDDEAAFISQVENTGQRALPPNPVPAIYNTQSKIEITVTEDGERKKDFLY